MIYTQLLYNAEIGNGHIGVSQKHEYDFFDEYR